jgi:hypothetical protein
MQFMLDIMNTPFQKLLDQRGHYSIGHKDKRAPFSAIQRMMRRFRQPERGAPWLHFP